MMEKGKRRMSPYFRQGEENDFDLFIDKFAVDHRSRMSWGQMVQQKVHEVNKSYICATKIGFVKTF